MSMSSSKWGGTKLLCRARRGNMKGDVSVWRASRIGGKGRRASTAASPFAIKCETHIYYASLPYEAKGDTRTRGASRIRSHALKF
jgi:hypothetical protein